MADARGLMAFWADIDADYVTEYRRWHNCEHMSERVHIPGFLTGRRYCGRGDAAMFLMYYETETPEVLASEAYHAALNRPTPWTGEALKHFRNPARNIYRLVSSKGDGGPVPTPFLVTLRFNVADDEEAVRAEYVDGVLPKLGAREDVARARLWEIDENISGIMTSERQIYGGGSGQQKYLVFVEMTSEVDAMQPQDLPGMSAGHAALHRDVFAESGWLDFHLDAPRS